MPDRRVMMVGLDGFEASIAERMLAIGKLPVLAKIIAGGTTTPLDHGAARRTGLAWEHVSTGLSPEDAGRWAAVDFQSGDYIVTQRATDLTPFPAQLPCRTVVFDPPYFDLSQAPEVQGVTAWGAHDPGVESQARPRTISYELASQFGAYPAQRFIYGFVWPSEEKTREMSQALCAAVDVRANAAEWLFADRLPDWELGYLVVSEYHSALEALWHGIDPEHPLNKIPSAAPAREGVEGVYEAVDRLMGRLLDRFPDTNFVFFNLHGMGANSADVASMVLLPELLHRASFGKKFMGTGAWSTLGDGTPLLAEDARWSEEVLRLLPRRRRVRNVIGRARRRIGIGEAARGVPLDWMPAAHYADCWPQMRAFALPSFYDGRIRVNLAGREAKGMVSAAEFESCCDEVEGLLRACTDPRTSEPVVAEIVRTSGDPFTRTTSEPDLTIVWAGRPLGLAHPTLGTTGPFPYRRTGGHTGGDGVAYFYGPEVGEGTAERRAAFDVVPTVVDLLGLSVPNWMTGSSFAPVFIDHAGRTTASRLRRKVISPRK